MFGEEFIFRGILLMDGIKGNKWVFWIANVIQAILYSWIHSFFIDEISGKIIFTAYVFAFSIFAGWLNNKYNSLLPSFLLHWGNGIHEFFFVFL